MAQYLLHDIRPTTIATSKLGPSPVHVDIHVSLTKIYPTVSSFVETVTIGEFELRYKLFYVIYSPLYILVLLCDECDYAISRVDHFVA